MRKQLLLLILLHLLILLASCVILPYDVPYGVWKSDDPDIYLEIVSKLQKESTGVYVKNGEELDVFLTFDNFPGFLIEDNDAYYYNNETGKWAFRDGYVYFIGKFELKGDKLYYYARWSDLTGEGTGQDTRTIIFERVSEEGVQD